MLKYTSVIRFAAWLFCSQVQATGGGFWIVPNGDDNDLTQTFPANTPLDLTWSGQPALSSFTPYDNATTEADLFSLFVTAFQLGNSFSQLIASGINLTSAGTYRWNTSLPASALSVSQQYVLRFIIETDNVNGFPSPGFLIQGGTTTTTSSSSSPSTTSSSTSISPATSTSSTTSTSSASGTVPPSSGGLSTGAKIGIGVAAAAVVLALLVGAYSWYRRKRKQSWAAGPQIAEMQGYQDALPAEMAITEQKDKKLTEGFPKYGAGPQHELPG